jgi:hypothetical protein
VSRPTKLKVSKTSPLNNPRPDIGADISFRRYGPIFVAKLDEEQLARNIRIEAREFLNQHCPLVLGLESILRVGPLKIVLQQNRP